jgi:hypothetical protein
MDHAPLIVIFICSGLAVTHNALWEAICSGFPILPKPMKREHVEMVINAVKAVKEKKPMPEPEI